MKPLPGYVNFDPENAFGAGGFLDLYVCYSASISPMTPALFHESAALFLASVAIARRIKVNMGYGDVYPNLFIIWLAMTTLYRKTTAMKAARQITRVCFQHLMAAEDTTPEALISDMAGQEPAHFDKYSDQDKDDWKAARNFAGQKGWILDELSGLLNGAGKDYNLGLIESILKLSDCEDSFTRSTIGRGRVTVRNSYLSILGASTPAAMVNHMGASKLWLDGWWSRFAILTPSERPGWQKPEVDDGEADIEKILNRLYSRLKYATWPDAHPTVTARIAAEAEQLWNDYNRAISFDLLQDDDLDHRLHGAYGRLPEQALKIAVILAALDWPEFEASPTIGLAQMTRALIIAESWRESAHRALEEMSVTEARTFYDRILRTVARSEPGGATARDVYLLNRDRRPSEIGIAMQEMVDLGILTNEQPKGPGRPTIKYHVAKDE